MANRLFSGVDPPDWAISGLPPPPLPPKISETSLTISTALIFCVIFFSTAITTEALPSILLIRQTISDLLFLINVSAFDFNSLIAKSSNITYSKLTPLIVS